MKVFNKNKAIRKINLQQNKNTYIKRLSISLSCLFLLVCVILFTFAKFDTSSDIYTLINGQMGQYPKNVCNYEIGKTWTFDYNGTNGSDGSAQTFNVPCNGEYKIELWGAQGGDANNISGGKGGYTSGNIKISANSKVYLYVGGKGSGGNNQKSSYSGGYNGGGSTASQSSYESRYFASGGGATDIRLVSGSWYSFDSLKSRIMVAGGGGGAYRDASDDVSVHGGGGGGLTGITGEVAASTSNWTAGTGGTQTNAGNAQCLNSYCGRWSGTEYGGYYSSGSFGSGGVSVVNLAGAGGSGYYGGGAAIHVYAGGGGGSSFISGYSGCNAIAESSTENNITHTNQPNHYSGYVFNNSVMIDGAGCNWSTGVATNCGSNQVQPNGTNAVGHSGNGYARITLLSTTDRIKIKLNANGGILSENEIIKHQNRRIGQLPEPTKEGNTFSGWFLDQTFTTEVNENTIVTSQMQNIYAKWEPNQYKITFNYNYNVINNGEFTNGLTGWNSKNGATLTIDSTVKTPDNRSSIKVCGSNIWAGLSTTNVDYKLGKSYTFSFQAYRNTQISSFNSGVSLKHSGIHYNPSVNFNNQSEINQWTTKTTNVIFPDEANEFLVYGNYNTAISANECVWVTNYIMIQYEEKNMIYGSNFTALDNPTRTGYTFQGWYTQASGGSKITSSNTVPAADTTYYAHWS